MSDKSKAEILAQLRACLDRIDASTRLPGEPSLREAVATQARERLAELHKHPAPATTTDD